MIKSNNRRLLLAGLTLAVLGVPVAAPALAQGETSFSGKPIRLIVPFPPGGGGDRLGRLLAEPLGKALNTSIIVENQGGANGNIALQTVARAEPSGHVLGLTIVDQIAVNPLIYDSLGCGFKTALVVRTEQELEAATQTILHGDGPVLVTVKISTEPQPTALPPRDGPYLRSRFREALLGSDAHR